MSTLLGVQCFGLQKELSKDFNGTIKRIKNIGFQAIEPCIVFKKKQGKMPKNQWSLELLKEAKTVIDETDLSMYSAHIQLGLFPFWVPYEKITHAILDIHNMTGIKYFVFSGMFSRAKQAKKWGKLLAKIQVDIKPFGCQVLYHNHEDEFHEIEIEGEKVTALDYFFQFAGSDVLLQLDIGWAGFADDEIRTAQQYASRIAGIHCKDFYAEAMNGSNTKFSIPKTSFAPIGCGVIKTKEILEMRKEFSSFTDMVIIDQDHSGGDILEDLVIGYKNIRKWTD